MLYHLHQTNKILCFGIPEPDQYRASWWYSWPWLECGRSLGAGIHRERCYHWNYGRWWVFQRLYITWKQVCLCTPLEHKRFIVLEMQIRGRMARCWAWSSILCRHPHISPHQWSSSLRMPFTNIYRINKLKKFKWTNESWPSLNCNFLLGHCLHLTLKQLLFIFTIYFSRSTLSSVVAVCGYLHLSLN